MAMIRDPENWPPESNLPKEWGLVGWGHCDSGGGTLTFWWWK